MGKWTNLKGQVPAAPVEQTYGDKIRAEQAELRTTLDGSPASMKDHVTLYNTLHAEKVSLAAREKEINLSLEALTGLINECLNQSGSDIWRGEGYSFSENVEPYASVADKAAVLEHFLPLNAIRTLLKRGGVDGARRAGALLDQAIQKSGILSVPFQTLNAMVKAEAEAGDLTIETINEGEDNETTVVKSTIPGVNVYLKTGLNRRKS